jgi:hypothetical protein
MRVNKMNLFDAPCLPQSVEMGEVFFGLDEPGEDFPIEGGVL